MQEKNKILDDLLADPFGENLPLTTEDRLVKKQNGEEPPKRLVDTLPFENQTRVFELVKQIDPTDAQAMTLYGTQAQGKLSTFSHEMLSQVQKQDIGEVGQIINDLMQRLTLVSPDDLKEDTGFFKRLFGKVSRSIQETLSKYQKVSTQIDRISVQLEQSKNRLLKDVEMLEQLYAKNKDYFDAINIYIAAAELKLIQLKEETIPALKKQAEASGDQMDAQAVHDMVQFTDRLEKRMYDLQLSRQITIQTAPQIRLIQNTNQALAEKIQSSIMTAIPLWKNQIVITLALLRQKSAVDAQKQVTETTNTLLLKNSEMLKESTIETARANEQGLIDIETLKKTQENLMTALEETLRIQAEGRIKRQQAQSELENMEESLKQRLLNLKHE
ncbi:MAG TPA: toxic anion resistance protein [Firmicutes bacterium]|nr:toxic anion resistance protein [Bacillales bacterium]HJA41253.1 toxic anion resistance protein [Bacillota bacterium]